MQQVNWKNANYIFVITYQQLYISCMSCSMKCIQIVLELDVDHELGRCQVRVSLLDVKHANTIIQSRQLAVSQIQH